MERVREIHESNEKFYKEMFRMDVILCVLIAVVALPCVLYSGVVSFINGRIVITILDFLLLVLNSFNLVATIKRMIRRYKDRLVENAAYEALVSLERRCSELETEL